MAGLPLDRGHADARDLVAMTATTAVLAPALELEDPELLAAPVLEDLGGHGSTLHRRTADGELVAVPDQQHLVELEVGARLASEARHVQDLVGHDPGLDA